MASVAKASSRRRSQTNPASVTTARLAVVIPVSTVMGALVGVL